jgi:hypothetical protein
MRTLRITGESLAFQPEFVDSDEIRTDRMIVDPILTMQSAQGGINGELSYPEDLTPLSEILRSAFYNTWTVAPAFDNDGTADSVITDAGTSANTYVVTSGGASAVLGHLVRATGFTNSANNQIFRVASSTATTIVGTALGLVAEAVPPAAARLKVVGFQGAAADITTTATGLGSTALNFTTLGLTVGQWIKIGGTAAGDKFATAAVNDWVRITAIAATALTCDNLPSGWGVDAGAGKTIKVWFGDVIKNGITQTGMTIERGFMQQTVPTYIVTKGMVVDTLTVTLASKDKIKFAVAFKGMGGSQSTTTLDATFDVATTSSIMAGNANVGRIAENTSTLTSPNWAKQLEWTLSNNLRALEAVDNQNPVAIRAGESTVTGKISTYFGDNALLTKFYNATTTAINARVTKSSQAVIFTFPRVTLKGGGNPAASGKNTDIYADFDFAASMDSTTSSQVMMDRVSYYEV